MFDRLPAQLIHSPVVGTRRRLGGRISTALLSIGLAVGLAVTAGPMIAPSAAVAATLTDESGGSIQYQEALSHAGETYSFSPGPAATVPFVPRADDSTVVDGAAPLALPAAKSGTPGAKAVAPSYAGPSNTISALRREIFGFLPYWELSSTLNYDTLSTIAYFGVSVGSDGSLYEAGNGWAGWNSSTMTTIINTAHAHGTRIVLTAQSFAWGTSEAASQTALLSSPTARQNAAATIAATVRSRGVDGVDLDFEPIASGQRTNYVLFVQQLRIELDKLQPGYELTFCATGAPGTYDLPNLLAPGAADAVFIMGYNLRGADPATAGSIDPLTSTLTRYTLSSVVSTYLGQVPASKVILGLPWYGAAYSTATNHALNAVRASSTTYGKPVESYYSTLSALAAQSDSTHLGKFYDNGEQTAWTAYYGTFGGQPTWREGYFDDAQALGVKCDAIDSWNLRGVGMWALGYDNNNGNGDLTAEIAAKFETGVAGTTYHAVDPARILDTRAHIGLSGKLVANTPRTFQVTGAGGVPTGATAVTGNATVVNQTSTWAVYLGPFALSKPPTSTVNVKRGETTANGVTLALSSTGTLSATYMAGAGNTTDLVFDVTGYFTPDTTGATYHPMDPVRVLDSRVGNGLKGKFQANTARTFRVADQKGIPAGVAAVTGNLTVVNATSTWAAYVGPKPLNHPLSSTVNFTRSQTISNGLTVAVNSDGTLSATFMSGKGNTTDLVFDVTGFYTNDATGLRFVPVTPQRLLDSRAGNGLSGKFKAKVARAVPMAGRISLPSSAKAISANLTVVNETSSWAVWAGPNTLANPTTSTINFLRGDVKANNLTVGLRSTGSVSLMYLSSPGRTTDLVLDVTGYFVP
jgi:spore germination protein YaaH